MVCSTYSGCPRSKKCRQLISATSRMIFFRNNLSEKFLGMTRIEPGAAAWEDSSVLCRPLVLVSLFDCCLQCFSQRLSNYSLKIQLCAQDIRESASRYDVVSICRVHAIDAHQLWRGVLCCHIQSKLVLSWAVGWHLSECTSRTLKAAYCAYQSQTTTSLTRENVYLF